MLVRTMHFLAIKRNPVLQNDQMDSSTGMQNEVQRKS